MISRNIASLLKIGQSRIISSHTRNMEVLRYKNVIIFNVPLYYEAEELAEIIDVIKEEHNLKIRYSVKEDPKKNEEWLDKNILD
jgi:hypothetical protein